MCIYIYQIIFSLIYRTKNLWAECQFHAEPELQDCVLISVQELCVLHVAPSFHREHRCGGERAKAGSPSPSSPPNLPLTFSAMCLTFSAMFGRYRVRFCNFEADGQGTWGSWECLEYWLQLACSVSHAFLLCGATFLTRLLLCR